MLSAAEARLVASPGMGRAALVRLQASTVALIGAGLLGGQLSYHFALLGIGHVVIDCGSVEPANLGNQGFPSTELTQAKSAARARLGAALNPACALLPVTARIEDLGLAALAGVDLLATGLDGRAGRMRVNEISLALGIPWIDAAVDGSGRSLRGTVTVYDPRQAGSPCYGCRFDARDLHAISGEGRGPGCPSWRRADVALSPPTLQASPFGAIVAGVQALWATRLLLQRGGDIVGRQLVIDGDAAAPRIRVLELQRNARCLMDHGRLQPLEAFQGQTIGELLQVAAAELGAEVGLVRFHGRTLVCGLGCPHCGRTRDLTRVAEAVTDDEVRCTCAGSGELEPLAMTNSLEASAARCLGDTTWTELGLPAADVVTAAAGDREVHYVVNAPRSSPPASNAWQGGEA